MWAQSMFGVCPRALTLRTDNAMIAATAAQAAAFETINGYVARTAKHAG